MYDIHQALVHEQMGCRLAQAERRRMVREIRIRESARLVWSVRSPVYRQPRAARI